MDEATDIMAAAGEGHHRAIPHFAAGAEPAEQRKHTRFPVALPATVNSPTGQASALIHDIAAGGAMIETSLRLWPGAPLSLRCGTINVQAIVTWRKHGRIGIGFHAPLADQLVIEQVGRSQAIAARRRNHQSLKSVCRVLA